MNDITIFKNFTSNMNLCNIDIIAKMDVSEYPKNLDYFLNVVKLIR